MRFTKVMSVLVGLGSLAACQARHKPAPEPKSQSGLFIDAEMAKMTTHAKILVKMGRMSTNFITQAGISTILGQYSWHGDGRGYFGAYSFYPPALEQAKRGWFLHGEVLEGSNELWPQDDWDTNAQAHEIKFDESVIGYKLPPMNMSWFEHGKYVSGWFTAKIVGVTENGHVALLDKTAPHHAEQWGMQIVPEDWQDMCGCTNNFSPPFVEGHPVVEPLTMSNSDSR